MVKKYNAVALYHPVDKVILQTSISKRRKQQHINKSTKFVKVHVSQQPFSV